MIGTRENEHLTKPSIKETIKSLEDEIREKLDSSLTKDYHILPPASHIQDLIKADANDISNYIKEVLYKNVESGRGSAECRKDISDLYYQIVVDDLKKWAKLHGYKFHTDGGLHTITAKGIKRKKRNTCSKCGRGSLALTRFLISSGLTIFWMSIGISLACWLESPYMRVIVVGAAIMASMFSIACAVQWDE